MGERILHPFDQSVADKICSLIMESERGLHWMTKQNPDLPSVGTIMDWLRSNEDFAKQYARAKDVQIERMFEKINEIADDTTDDLLTNPLGEGGGKIVSGNSTAVQRAKLRVDALKWQLSKLAPKKYGDKLDVTTDGEKVTGVTVVVQSPDTAKDQNELKG